MKSVIEKNFILNRHEYIFSLNEIISLLTIARLTDHRARASVLRDTRYNREGGLNVTLKTNDGGPLYQSFPFLDNCFCLSGSARLALLSRFLPSLLLLCNRARSLFGIALSLLFSSPSFSPTLSFYPVITSPIAFIDLPITVLSRYNGVAASGPNRHVRLRAATYMSEQERSNPDARTFSTKPLLLLLLLAVLSIERTTFRAQQQQSRPSRLCHVYLDFIIRRYM